jgi:PPOX class probable F420-dependent enzyme
VPAPPLPPELDAFLAQPNQAVIATLRPDGHPHTVPTWYEWSAGRLLVNMDESRSRLGHLRRDPRVALTVFAGSDWYSHVSILGRVRELRPDPDLADIDRLSRRYRGERYWNRERKRVTAVIEPERWFTWGDPGGSRE